MGNACASKTLATNPPKGASAPKKEAKPQKKLDPKDYVFSKKTGEVLVKEEGTIDGQQFNIEECKDCDIFLFDVIATAFIDECENCRIFVGPVESSIFVRNCTNCDFVIACQQFRSRDCKDCKFALLSTTEPVVETSSNMQFACFDFTYFSLAKQLQAAGLTVWNNKWSMVYDFNKNPDRPNWSLLPQEQASQLLRLECCPGSVSLEEAQMDRVVPITLGARPWPSQESCFVVFLPDSDAYIEAFLAKVAKSDGWHLCRARMTRLPEEQAKELLRWTKEKKLVSQIKGREIAGIEVCGPGIWKQVETTLSTTGLAAGSASIRLVPEQDTRVLAKAFFEVWKDEI